MAAFTLAELLISLLILGVIVVFSIPKVLQSQTDSRKNALFKENIATIMQVTLLAVQQGDITANSHSCGTPSPADVDQIVNRINFSHKVACGANCWRLFMTNGSRITVAKGNVIDFQVNYDGVGNGPEQWGQDNMYFHYNDCPATYQTLPSGRFGPINSLPVGFVAENQALWDSIIIN